MSKVLAIETSTEIASVSLLMHGQVFTRCSTGVQTHSQAVLPMVQAVLADGGIALTECDAIAFGSGPGSFTGVRTACGVTQGLAFGANIPVVPVITLEAMAQSCRECSGADDVLAILDARMGEVYWAQYRYLDGWQTVVGPTLSKPEAVTPVGLVTACGNGLTAYASAFAGCKFFENSQAETMPHASAVAHLGAIAFANSQAVNARLAVPLYLRNKVALTTVERLAKAVM